MPSLCIHGFEIFSRSRHCYRLFIYYLDQLKMNETSRPFLHSSCFLPPNATSICDSLRRFLFLWYWHEGSREKFARLINDSWMLSEESHKSYDLCIINKLIFHLLVTLSLIHFPIPPSLLAIPFGPLSNWLSATRCSMCAQQKSRWSYIHDWKIDKNVWQI